GSAAYRGRCPDDWPRRRPSCNAASVQQEGVFMSDVALPSRPRRGRGTLAGLFIVGALMLPALATSANALNVPSTTVTGPIASTGIPGNPAHDYTYFT